MTSEATSTANDLSFLFRRDLAKLSKQIESFPNDEALWQTLPGVTNAAGNLALHIEGNLREFVGRQLGQIPYLRNRALEFSARDVSRNELVARLSELRDSIPKVIENLTQEQMEMEYPEVVLEAAMSTKQFLIHLYGHLNWHLGQVDYLRRISGVLRNS
ncbi:MAG TPA: DinB family protein [Pyrinomonadaceae bacterium]|nr:DinB family protein [Pyrinomonadaceae bacterium]